MNEWKKENKERKKERKKRLETSQEFSFYILVILEVWEQIPKGQMAFFYFHTQ